MAPGPSVAERAEQDNLQKYSLERNPEITVHSQAACSPSEWRVQLAQGSVAVG